MRVLARRKSIGGTCQWCGRQIARGEPIARMDDGRRRCWSAPGGGPGSWVCADCAGSPTGEQLPLFALAPSDG